MKFYKRDPDRALAGMAELSLRQRGAYNSLLDLLYSRDGNVPDDDARVARMISCHWREWATIKTELIAAGKVWVEDGKLCAKRVQDTIKEATDFSQEQSRKASSGWQKRQNNNENNEPQMPLGNASTPTPTPTKQPSVDAQAPEPSPKQILMSALDEETADAVIKHRKAKRAPITTALAARGLVKAFLEYPGGPLEAATMMVTNGWTGFKRDYWDKGQPRGSPTGRPLTGLAAVTQEFRKELENDGYANQGEEGGNPDADARFPLLAITDHGRGR